MNHETMENSWPGSRLLKGPWFAVAQVRLDVRPRFNEGALSAAVCAELLAMRLTALYGSRVLSEHPASHHQFGLRGTNQLFNPGPSLAPTVSLHERNAHRYSARDRMLHHNRHPR